jgi:hypothetical protein
MSKPLGFTDGSGTVDVDEVVGAGVVVDEVVDEVVVEEDMNDGGS